MLIIRTQTIETILYYTNHYINSENIEQLICSFFGQN